MARQTIFKRKRKSNFTTIPNTTLEDSGLTWEARGLLVYLLSKPIEWRVSVGQLIKAGPSSRRVVYRILQELQDKYYIIKTQLNEDGRFGTVCYEVYDEPHTRNVKADNEEDRLHENRKAVSAVADSVVQVNKDIVNKDINNKQVNKKLSERKEEFIKEVKAFTKYEKYHMDFINYWTENDGKKMKWEINKQKSGVFAIENRLNTFKLRDSKAETLKNTTNGVDVLTPILREIERVGGYGSPEFKEYEKDAQQVVRQIGWGRCCQLSEFDLKQIVKNNMSIVQ